MRKLLTLTLAVAMVLSMASVAFAATAYTVSTHYYGESSSIVRTTGTGANSPKIGYGKTAYYSVVSGSGTLTYDEAKELKVKPQWTQNADLVEKVSVIKKRTGAVGATTGSGYDYFIAVAVKAKDTTSTAEIAGKMELSVKSGNTIVGGTLNKLTINPFITVGYDRVAGATVSAPVDSGASGAIVTTFTISQKSNLELTDSDKIYEFGDAPTTTSFATVAYDESDGIDAGEQAAIDAQEAAAKTAATNAKLAATDEFEIDLYGGAGTFTVDTKGQGKLLLSSTVKYNEGLENIYPDANYVYINGNGKSFNKTGELKLWANEGEFLYQVKGDKLVKLDVAYDDVEEAFILKTRTLGTYVIAEEELDLSKQVVAPEAPAPVEPVNPGTGAAL